MERQISLHLMALLIHSLLCLPGTAGALPPSLEIKDVKFPQVVYATESCELVIDIKNIGLGEARKVAIELTSNLQDLEMPTPYIVPLIPRGSTKEVKIQVKGGADLSNNAKAQISIRLIDNEHRQEFPFDKPKVVEFKTRELELVFDQIDFKNMSKPGKRIEPNTMIHLNFHVLNKSRVTARDIKIEVKNNQEGVTWYGMQIGKLSTDEDLEKDLEKEPPRFEELKQNEHKVVNYLYHLNQDFNNSEAKFTLRGTVGDKKDPWMEKEAKSPVSVPSNWLHNLAWWMGIAIVIVVIIIRVVRSRFSKIHTWGLHWWERGALIFSRFRKIRFRKDSLN